MPQRLLKRRCRNTQLMHALLMAWQRMDVGNYYGIAQLAIGFAVLWIGFHFGLGIYSLLAGAAASWICGVVLNAAACFRLGFWPRAGEWGRASREQFHELFSYGAELFLITIGTQLIVSSQTVLVSRQLGMEAAALWSVMTKLFTLVTQIVTKIVGNAMPAFAEMQVRQERARLWDRYRGLFIIANVFAGLCGVLLAACNGPFVSIWTHGRFSWPATDNVLLALWLILSTQQCCHNSLIMCLKHIRGLKYIFLLEGVLFVGVAVFVLPANGITGMLICSTALCTWLCGVWRIAELSGKGWEPLVWDWQWPLFWIVGFMVPCWLASEWMLRGAPDWLRLVINCGLLTLIGTWVSLRFALPSDLAVEMVGKLPQPLQRMAIILGGPACRRDIERA